MTSKFNKAMSESFLGVKRMKPILSTAEDDSILHYVGDVTGKRVLDLGCGEGSCARLLKTKGADLVVGVDISEHMIKVAREKEAMDPLGIEYVVKDGSTMEKIGEFDVVVGNLLFYFVDSEEQLQGFADVIYKNLVSGGKFFSYTLDVAKTKWSAPAEELFGSRITEVSDAPNGWWIRFQNLPSRTFKTDVRALFLYPNIYEQVFIKAGFKSFSFNPPFISKETLDSFPKGYWDPLLNDPIFSVLIAQK